MKAVRLLTFSTLYPNPVQPTYGLFVEHRLTQLMKAGGISGHVVAPVPWFPFSHQIFGRYAVFARVPRRERRNDIDVTHPPVPVVPKFGMRFASQLMVAGIRRHVRSLLNESMFNLIDAHYLYPDGVAAASVAQQYGLPFVLTAHGSDINVLAEFPFLRRKILWAAEQSAAVISVSSALAGRMSELGFDGRKVFVLPNRVDLDLFRPIDRDEAKRRIGIKGPVLLAVGNLIEGKGQDIAIRALANIPLLRLLIVGEGPRRQELESLARNVGVLDRVLFIGAVAQDRLPMYYSAAEALVLASAREGMPCVVLESLACGTPAIASNVGGIPEVISVPEAGCLMDELTPEALIKAFDMLRDRMIERDSVRRFAERFGWRETAIGQLALYRKVLSGDVTT